MHNAAMMKYMIRPIIVVPDEQYYKLIAVRTKDTFSADCVQYLMCSTIVRHLIDIILVCEEN